MTKRIIIALLALTFLGCANKPTEKAEEKNLKISDLYVGIENILNTNFNVLSIQGIPIKDTLGTAFNWGETYEETKKRIPSIESTSWDTHRLFTTADFIEVGISFFSEYYYDNDIGLYMVVQTIVFDGKTPDEGFSSLYNYYDSTLKTALGRPSKEKYGSYLKTRETSYYTQTWYNNTSPVVSLAHYFKYISDNSHLSMNDSIILVWFSPRIQTKPSLLVRWDEYLP